MFGFRNTLVHECQQLDIQLLVKVIEHHLNNLIYFANSIL